MITTNNIPHRSRKIRLRAIVHTCLLLALLFSVVTLNGCCINFSTPEIISLDPDALTTTPATEPPEPPQTTEPAFTSKYQPGSYTTEGYSSQWLDLSFSASWPLELTEKNLEVNTVYNQALRNSDPYNTFEEMVYYWSGTNEYAVAIYIKPLENTHASLKELVDEQWSSIVSTYSDMEESSIGQSLNLSNVINRDDTQTISYLGNDYILDHHQVVIYHNYDFFNHLNYWNMYRIVDDHLVWFQFQTDYTQDWNLDFFLSLFTSYDGTVTYEKEVIEATPAITENGVFNVLSFSTVWTAKFHYQGYYYNVYLVFEEAGTCYYALGLDHSELLLAGKGTYSVSGYTLNLSITASGDLYTGTYDFNPNSLQLTQTSYTSITGSTATGTKLALSIDTTNDVEKIVNWGNTYTYRDPYSDWE